MAIKKITLPDNTTQDIQDSRIPGVDSTPTSESTNLVTSGGVYTSLSSKADDSGVVHKTGNETIAGAKTFTASPVLANNLSLNVLKDDGTTDVRALYMSTANNLIVGRDLVGLGALYLYGETVGIRAGGTSTVLNITSAGATVTGNFSVTDGTNTVLNTSSSKFNSYVDTAISKTGGGVLYLHGDTSNGNSGSIIFRSRGDSYPYNGFKIAGERSSVAPYSYDRQDLVFYSSNDADYTCTWIEAMRISKEGNVTIGTASSPKDFTVGSTSNIKLSGTSNTLADIIPNITISSSEPTSSQGSNGDIWIVV